jgi:hypothetical protein
MDFMALLAAVAELAPADDWADSAEAEAAAAGPISSNARVRYGPMIPDGFISTTCELWNAMASRAVRLSAASA